MRGWLYLIKNRDLYKIGITRNIDNRMRQLKPDKIIVRLYTKNFKQLEKKLHMRYKNVRIPQTEYFRLNDLQLRDFKNQIRAFNYPNSFIFKILIDSFSLLSFSFVCISLSLSLIINDINYLFFQTTYLLSRIAIFYSLLSIFQKSNQYINLFFEIKFRVIRSCIYLFFAFLLWIWTVL